MGPLPPCHSPTRQNNRHVELISRWLEKTGVIKVSYPAAQWIKPVVVFTRASWLKATQFSMLVLDSALGLALYLKRQKEVYLDAWQIDKISLLLAYPQLHNAQPIHQLQTYDTPVQEPPVVLDAGYKPGNTEEQAAAPEREAVSEITQEGNRMEVGAGEPRPEIETGRTKGGQEYVRVYGSKEVAEAVRREYLSKGRKTSHINKDKYRQGIWYFYLDRQ